MKASKKSRTKFVMGRISKDSGLALAKGKVVPTFVFSSPRVGADKLADFQILRPGPIDTYPNPAAIHRI